jgi:hypothetical protein
MWVNTDKSGDWSGWWVSQWFICYFVVRSTIKQVKYYETTPVGQLPNQTSLERGDEMKYMLSCKAFPTPLPASKNFGTARRR